MKTFRRNVWLKLSLVLALAGPLAGQAVDDRPVVAAGQGGYFSYRIPALVARGDTAVIFLEGRKTSPSDFGWIDLIALRSTDGGRSWGRAAVIASEGGAAEKITMGNPCPVFDAETGRLWCLYTRENQQVYALSSGDAGATWSPPREITSAVRPPQWTRYWTGPGHGLQLQHGPKRGRLIFPSYHLELVSTDGGETYLTYMRSHMVYSDDHGQTWRIGASTELGAGLALSRSHIGGAWVPGEVTCEGGECLAAELPDGRLFLISRNEAHDSLAKLCAWSADGGESWSPLQASAQLPDPGCQGSILAPSGPSGPAANGVIFAGITSDGRQPGQAFHDRQRLALWLSGDGCRTWREARVVHARAAAYCDLAALPEGRILCVYEGGEHGSNESIRLARFDGDWLRPVGPAAGRAP